MVVRKRKPNYFALMAGFGLVLGPELYKIQDWGQVWTPPFIGSIVFQIAGVMVLWMSNGMSAKAFVAMRKVSSNTTVPPNGEE